MAEMLRRNVVFSISLALVAGLVAATSYIKDTAVSETSSLLVPTATTTAPTASSLSAEASPPSQVETSIAPVPPLTTKPSIRGVRELEDEEDFDR